MNNQNINLDFIKVRPIRSGEEKTWNLLMARHHYLGFKILVGESIKYVATYGEDGQWVALIGWGAPALKIVSGTAGLAGPMSNNGKD